MRWYESPTGGNRIKDQTNFERARDDYDRRPIEYYRDTMDAAYATSSAAYTGGTGGFPAGDLNWHPDKLAEWQDFLTGVQAPQALLPTGFELANFPNPFNPETNITFSLPQSARVSLTIYNALGQEVARLVDSEQYIAGTHKTLWNGTNQAGEYLSSGVYFYRLQTSDGAVNMTKKMLLMK
jgi:hypothetical protein